jgi:hypothetical protein
VLNFYYYQPLPKSWNKINKAITAIDIAKIKAMIIACSIFGAAEGFLPSALILAYPIAAITVEGPMIVTNITINMTKFCKIIPQQE